MFLLSASTLHGAGQGGCTRLCMLSSEQGDLARGPGGAEIQPMPGSLSQMPTVGPSLLRTGGSLFYFGKGFICIQFSDGLILKM